MLHCQLIVIGSFNSNGILSVLPKTGDIYEKTLIETKEFAYSCGFNPTAIILLALKRD